MGLRITTGNGVLENNIAKAQKEVENSLEKLSSGVKFSRNDPMPVERSRSDAMMSKMKELNTYKQNANDLLNATQTAESQLSQMSNTIIHMKELVAQATNPSLSDKERQFLFVEYDAYHEEIDRMATTTSHANRPLLDTSGGVDVSGVGTSRNSKGFWARVGAPVIADGKDTNIIKVEGVDNIRTRPEDLGLVSVKGMVKAGEGVSLDDVYDIFGASSPSDLGKSFDDAHLKVSEYRASFGAATSRIASALNSLDTAYENVAAANSRIRDVDYATETAKLVKANMLVQAGSSLLAQSQNTTNTAILSLVKNIDKNG